MPPPGGAARDTSNSLSGTSLASEKPRKLKALRSSATHSSTPSRRRTLSSSEGEIQVATFRQVITASRASRFILFTLASKSAGEGEPFSSRALSTSAIMATACRLTTMSCLSAGASRRSTP